MNLIALLVALALERLLPLAWRVAAVDSLLAYVRAALRLLARGRPQPLVAALLAALPGALAALLAALCAARGEGLLSVLVAAAVLFLTLGPRDLDEEVRAYVAAAAAGEGERAAQLAAALLDHDAGQRRGAAFESVGEAVFVQANDRLFGVLFWFVLTGPFGALAFRVTDLMRREALRRALRGDAPASARPLADVSQRQHGVLAFLPARLLALTYGAAGSFEESFAGWSRYLREESGHFFDANDRLLVHAGRGALGARWEGGGDAAGRAAAAAGLVRAAFYVWIVAVATLTLVAWIA